MSGFSNEDARGSGKWANFKGGKVVTVIDGERKEFTHLTGDLVDIIQTTETYQGEEYEKISLCIVHDDGMTKIGFPLRSGYCRGLCKIGPNINFHLPVKLSSSVQEDKKTGAKYGSIFISQNDKALKHYYTVSAEDPKKKFPQVENIPKKKGSKETYKDYEKLDTFCLKIISAMLKKIKEIYPEGAEAYKTPEKPELPEMEPSLDDLPF